MKPEEIMNALNDVNDEYITDAAPKKRKKRPLWLGAAAAAVCACVVGAGVFSNMTSLRALAVAQAEYPERTEYASGIIPLTEKQRDKWVEERKQRFADGEAAEQTTEFFRASVSEFLTSDSGENLVYSPMNLYLALAMLAETTAGETQGEILNLLGQESSEELRETAQKLWNANYIDDGRMTCLLANSMWLDDDFIVKQSTADVLAQSYRCSTFRGEMGSAKMNNALKDWLDTQTKGFLSQYTSGEKFTELTRMALASTIYFNARWSDEFNSSLNYTAPFHGANGDRDAEYMKQTLNFLYCSDSFMATSLPFREGGGMMLFLPDEDKTVADVLRDSGFSEVVYSPNTYENSKCMKVHLSLPKFDVSSKLELSDGLKSLGLNSVFDPLTADFSAISSEKPLWLDMVTHAARVKIDEKGCEAAAYTLEMLCGSAVPPEEEIDLVLDRPFVFVIVSDTGCPLFVGVVNK